MTAPPRVMVVEDIAEIRKRVCTVLERAGYEVVPAVSFGEGRAVIDAMSIDCVMLDISLAGDREDGDPNTRGGVRLMEYIAVNAPNTPVVVVTSDTHAATAASFLQRGVLQYLNKPVPDEVTLHWAAVGIELARSRRIATDGVGVEALPKDGPEWHVGSTPAMLKAEQEVNAVAPTNLPVLIYGRTGTGKEVIARAIRTRSRRARGPFVWINCGSFSQNLIESELFGHEKGAFTGALEKKIGLFEVADGGTIFLDELSSLPKEAQPNLLRVLEDFTIRRVGGTKDIKVDVRVISATNQDLAEMVDEGTFREDLLYRLRVMPIYLPSLSERVPDIPYFATLFLRQEREGVKPPERLTERAITALCQHHWPGNIRELYNAMDRAAVLAAGAPLVDVNLLPPDVIAGGLLSERRNGSSNGARDLSSLDGVLPADLPHDGLDLLAVRDLWERRMMVQALARSDGNQTQAADLLRLTRDRWRSRASKFGIGD